jgi:molybdenum cofactor cytidylyltransferase
VPSPRKIRGLLLAGGAATRFGSAKLLHPYLGSTVGAVSARNLVAGVGNVLAVVREGDDAIASMLREAGCEVLVTERSRDGLGASIAAGVAASRDASGWVLALADMPRIPADVSRTVAAKLASGAKVVAPMLPTGERGHPVGFSAALLDDLLALTGEGGARTVLERYRGVLSTVATADRGVLYDIDRPSDLSPTDLRRATKADADAMSALALRSKAHWGYGAATMDAWRGALHVDPESLSSRYGYVAMVRDAMVAFYVIDPGEGAWTLDDLWVDPDFMGQGIGSTLMRHALATAWENGAQLVTVDADPNAEAFYVACGAVRVGEVAAPIEGDDARVRPQLEFRR